MQSYNRYSYVRNNPLKYTDPTGNREVHIIYEEIFEVTRNTVVIGDPVEGGTPVITTEVTFEQSTSVQYSEFDNIDSISFSINGSRNDDSGSFLEVSGSRVATLKLTDSVFINILTTIDWTGVVVDDDSAPDPEMKYPGGMEPGLGSVPILPVEVVLDAVADAFQNGEGEGLIDVAIDAGINVGQAAFKKIRVAKEIVEGARKKRSSRPDALPEADGRPHSILERPGPQGQYTTHNGDGTFKQFRGSGGPHNEIPRPNVKENTLLDGPNGQFPSKTTVRPATPDEIPGGG